MICTFPLRFDWALYKGFNNTHNRDCVSINNTKHLFSISLQASPQLIHLWIVKEARLQSSVMWYCEGWHMVTGARLHDISTWKFAVLIFTATSTSKLISPPICQLSRTLPVDNWQNLQPIHCLVSCLQIHIPNLLWSTKLHSLASVLLAAWNTHTHTLFPHWATPQHTFSHPSAKISESAHSQSMQSLPVVQQNICNS